VITAWLEFYDRIHSIHGESIIRRLEISGNGIKNHSLSRVTTQLNLQLLGHRRGRTSIATFLEALCQKVLRNGA
jgi:hypothetical protein